MFQFEIKDRQRKQEEEYRKQHPEEVARAKEERRRAYIVEFLPPEPPKWVDISIVSLQSTSAMVVKVPESIDVDNCALCEWVHSQMAKFSRTVYFSLV